MTIKELTIKGVFEIQLDPNIDFRGFFMRTYDEKIFAKFGLNRKWVQESHSFSKKKWTVRGIHFQHPPYIETKLIRVIEGKILFTIIDLRPNSKTFGKWVQIVVSADKKNVIYIPKGCAPCMCTLTRNCQILYKMDQFFTPESYDNIKWDDPDLAIDWPTKNPTDISQKDANAQSFKEFVKKYGGLKV